MAEKDSEPERKDDNITLDVLSAIAKVTDPKVSIEDRVANIGLVLQVLEQHVNEDREGLAEARKERGEDRKENRKWWRRTLAVAIIAILIGIFTPILISLFFH